MNSGIGPRLASESSIWASGQCSHQGTWRNYRVTKAGKQQVRCSICGKISTVGGRSYLPKFTAALKVLPFYRKRLTVREASRLSGIGYKVVARAYATIRKILQRERCRRYRKAHRENEAARRRIWIQRHRALGLCIKCSQPGWEGRHLCQKHTLNRREKRRKQINSSGSFPGKPMPTFRPAPSSTGGAPVILGIRS